MRDKATPEILRTASRRKGSVPCAVVAEVPKEGEPVGTDGRPLLKRVSGQAEDQPREEGDRSAEPQEVEHYRKWRPYKTGESWYVR